MSRRAAAVLPAAAAAGIALGLVVRLIPAGPSSNHIWLVALIVTGIPTVWGTVRGMLAGHFAADVVATLAILTAVLLGNPLPGLIIVLMQTGGEALERYAEGRASRAVRELEEAAPRIAHRVDQAGVTDIAVEEIAPGDTLLVRPGEMVPCDGEVISGRSHVDTASLTGEPIPVRAEAGTALMSGSLNLEGPLTFRATATAESSQYARIVELVHGAQASKTPLQRLADRYAVWFTPLTLAVAGGAWVASGEVSRVLAVLVVATPCPLILATPVAVLGGLNRGARRGIIFRHGGALEQLGGVTIAAFDKTGTLTIGRPEVADVSAVGEWTPAEVLRLAGSVEQGSGHLLAGPIVAAATGAGPLPVPSDVREAPGRGVTGTADGRRVSVGARGYVLEQQPGAADALPPPAAGLKAYVAIDDQAGGVITYADRMRSELPALTPALHQLGIRRTILLSGDSIANAEAVARSAGLDSAIGDLLPGGKAEKIRELMGRGDRILMVGDGTNDAPALATATVGMAMAAHGGGVTAEAAGVVLLADDLRLIPDAIGISRRTLRIARQSIWVGLGLSGVAMVLAAAGWIPPTPGAILQEAIDVLVIFNALRAS